MNKVLLFMSVGLAITLNACQSSGEKAAQSGGDNPFLSEYTTPFGVPPFDKIRITDYKPAFLQGMEEEQKEKEEVEKADKKEEEQAAEEEQPKETDVPPV